MITNSPMNVTECSGTKANISCGYTGVYDFVNARPNWRIIKETIMVVLSVMKLFLALTYLIIKLMDWNSLLS